jgi:peptidyl-prolyl cis-trans isomerase SurA
MPVKILLLASFILISLAFSKQGEKLDGIAAVVGDETILQSDLDTYTAMRLTALKIKPDSADLPKYRKQYIEELVDGKVLVAYAKNDTTITVTNDEVESALDNHINSILQQNNITVDSLEKLLEKEQGLTYAKFKAETKTAIRDQLLKQKIQRQYLSTIKVSRRDVETFYAQYRDSLPKAGESVLLSKIAVSIAPPPAVRQAAWEKISSIKQRLSSGADFAAMAKQFSESPEGATGGDIGFIGKGTLSEVAFEQKAFSLSVGQTSDPFETKLGFHIINVVDKKDQTVHIRQIFVKVAPPADLVKKETALLDSVRATCKSAADFIAAVRALSTDKPTKIHDGRLGWKSIADCNDALKSAIDSLHIGDISSVLNDGNELAVFRIDDRAPDRTLTLEDDWLLLADKAKDIQSQKKLIELVARWRRQVYINIRK